MIMTERASRVKTVTAPTAITVILELLSVSCSSSLDPLLWSNQRVCACVSLEPPVVNYSVFNSLLLGPILYQIYYYNNTQEPMNCLRAGLFGCPWALASKK